MTKEKESILNTLEYYKKQIELAGYNVYAIMLKGSQNYNLSDDESDIDANVIFIPTLRQLRDDKPFKMSFMTGEATCHNIYSFADIVAKGNPQWIEVCHTEYIVGEDISMFKHFNLNPSALKGMVMEKVTAFDKLYPSREKYVKQFGYDPKQLHHIIRLYDILEKNVNVYKYEGEQREWMMKIKRGTLLSREEAFELRDSYVELLTNIYEERKLSYMKQEIDLSIIDKIVLDEYKKL